MGVTMKPEKFFYIFSQETKQKIEQAKQDHAQQMKQIADKYQVSKRGTK